MLWILATGLTIFFLAAFAWLRWRNLWDYPAPFRFVDLANMATLVVALFSLYVAIAAYQESVRDSEEQQKSLDASREQLQAVVESLKSQQHLQSQSLDTSKALLTLQERLVSTTREQQDVLTQSLETSRTLLALQKEERERLQELANRKPKVLALLGDVILEKSKVEIPLTVEKGTNRAYLPLHIRNVGTASLQKPSYVAHTPNREGTIWLEGTISDVKRPFHTEQSGLMVKDLLTFRGSGTTYNSGIYIVAPETVSELDIMFSLTGENLDSPFVIEFHVHLNRA
jgi:hypothetical protein